MDSRHDERPLLQLDKNDYLGGGLATVVGSEQVLNRYSDLQST